MSGVYEDRAEREPVWHALAELYLDQPYRPFVRSAAVALAATRYSADELRAILFEEVHPVVCGNLCAVTGVWDGFDPQWLAETILANQRCPRWRRPRGRCMWRYADLMWRLLAPRVARARATRCAPPSLFDTDFGRRDAH